MLTVPDDNGGNNGLITPSIQATVNTTDNTQSPMSGILEICPCQPGTSIYYGNYVNDVLTPFPGYYNLQNGNIIGTNNRPISLPVGTYNMIYWKVLPILLRFCRSGKECFYQRKTE